MGGYQSNSGGGGITLFRNKGFLLVEENQPFPPGVKNDMWIVDNPTLDGGAVGATYNVENGDIIICLNANPGGNGNAIANAWTVIPRASDFVQEQE